MKKTAVLIFVFLCVFTIAPAVAQMYKDGVYTATGEDISGEVTIQLTVKGGKYTQISIMDGIPQDQAASGDFKTFLSDLVAQQDINAVDAVSGATMECDLVKKAIFEALKQAR